MVSGSFREATSGRNGITNLGLHDCMVTALGNTCETVIKMNIFKGMARVAYVLSVCVLVCTQVHVHLEVGCQPLMSLFRSWCLPPQRAY